MKRKNKILLSSLSVVSVGLSLTTAISCANMNENIGINDDWYCKWGQLENDGKDPIANVYPYKTQIEKIKDSGKMKSACVTYWKIDGCEWYADDPYHYPSSCIICFVDQDGDGKAPGLQYVYDPNYETNHRFSILISYVHWKEITPCECRLAQFIYTEVGNIFPNGPRDIWLHFGTPKLICEQEIKNWQPGSDQISFDFFAVNFNSDITYSPDDISVVSHDDRLIVNDWTKTFSIDDQYGKWGLNIRYSFKDGNPPTGLHLWPLTVSFKFKYQNVPYEVSSNFYISSYYQG